MRRIYIFSKCLHGTIDSYLKCQCPFVMINKVFLYIPKTKNLSLQCCPFSRSQVINIILKGMFLLLFSVSLVRVWAIQISIQFLSATVTTTLLTRDGWFRGRGVSQLDRLLTTILALSCALDLIERRIWVNTRLDRSFVLRGPALGLLSSSGHPSVLADLRVFSCVSDVGAYTTPRPRRPLGIARLAIETRPDSTRTRARLDPQPGHTGDRV